MKITRTINQEKVTFSLTEEEKRQLYEEMEQEKHLEEVADYLETYTVLTLCGSDAYLHDEILEDVVDSLLSDTTLLLEIYHRFEELEYERQDNSHAALLMREDSMKLACEEVMAKFNKEHPNFLKSFETIDAVAYRKYRKNNAACYESFLENEYQDDFFMKSLLDEVEFQKYLLDRYNVVTLNRTMSSDEYFDFISEHFAYLWYDIVEVNGVVSAEIFPITGEKEDGTFNIDAFLDAVAIKYDTDEVYTYMMDGIDFDPKELPFGAETCGCYKNGRLQFMDSSNVEELIDEVEDMMGELPDGFIQDADTVLADLIEHSDCEFSGISEDIFNIWRKSSDRKSVEQMFYEFTGVEFVDYLNQSKRRMKAVFLADIVRACLKDSMLDCSPLVDEFYDFLNNSVPLGKKQTFGRLMEIINDFLKESNVPTDKSVLNTLLIENYLIAELYS